MLTTFARKRIAVVCLSLRRAMLALLLAPLAAASATEAPNLGRAAIVDQRPYQVLIGPREHWDCEGTATDCAFDLPAVKNSQQLKLTLLSCFMTTASNDAYVLGTVLLFNAASDIIGMNFVPFQTVAGTGFVAHVPLDIVAQQRQRFRLLINSSANVGGTCFLGGTLYTLG